MVVCCHHQNRQNLTSIHLLFFVNILQQTINYFLYSAFLAWKILKASHLIKWRPLQQPCIMWLKTIQQDLKSKNLFLNEAIGSESTALQIVVYIWRDALILVHARKYEDSVLHFF